MNRDDRTYVRTIFMSKVHSANGQSYEDLFCNVLSHAYTDFLPIKPQGKIGDRKNDGYLKSIGRYYQVYAPEEPNHSVMKAIQKAEKDFTGLKSYWQNIYPVNEYHFVFNDKYSGSFPDLEKALKNIKETNKLKSADVFLAKHLEDILFSLPDDVVQTIVGHIPDSHNVEMIDYYSLREVIGYIMNNHKPLSAEPYLVVPEFEEKIKFNGLSKRVKALVDTASYQIGALDAYFNNNGAAVKQDLRDRLNEKYQEATKKDYGKVPADVSRGDLIFFEILKSITPDTSRSIENASIILMTKYFESCDIFEDPNG